MYTIHESMTEFKELPGRNHKMIIGPENFGKAKNMCFGIAEFPHHKHAPMHVHDAHEEIIYILSGEGEMYFNGKAEEIKPGTCVIIPPGVKHSINNKGDKVLKLIYVFSPPVKQGSYDKIANK